jgi:hypothetical protein
MSHDKHLVDKTIRSFDIKKVLSEYMKSLGYKAGTGWGGDIGMTFVKSNRKESVSFDYVVFQVQDSLNPEPEKFYISKKEALECIAKVKNIDLTKSDISIT